MKKFVHWSGIVHTTLSTIYPKLKLSQSRELFAAALGHNTYASLRVHDLAALESTAKYIVLDNDRVLERARSLGIPLTSDQWWDAYKGIKPSGVSGGCYIGETRIMESAARHVFEEERSDFFHELARRIGTKDGQWAHQATPLPGADVPPDELALLVHGEIWAFNDFVSLSTPVLAEVRFNKLGRQIYGAGWILNATQNGEPRPYEPIDEGDVYGP